MPRPLVALALVLGVLLVAPAAASAVVTGCPVNPSFSVNAGEQLDMVSTCTGDDLVFSVLDWPDRGSLVGDPHAGTATYTPTIGLYGPDGFVYQATDADGTFQVVHVAITVVAPPGAGGLPPSCPNPTEVFVPFHGSIVLTGNCSDPEGVTVGYALTSGTSFGNLFPVSASSVQYVHTASHFMPDGFGYSASDGVHTVFASVKLNITDPGAAQHVYSTAPEATSTTPFVASVQTTDPESVVVGTRPTSSVPSEGYFFLSTEWNILAPPQSDADPLRLTFTIDGSQVPFGDQVEIFRNGARVEAVCDDSDAIPDDPCVLSRGPVGDDYVIVVLTSQASFWNAGTSANYPFVGFFRPVDNQPTVNTANAGRAVPVKFSLGGDEGLDILAEGSPSSRAVRCPNGSGTDEVESTLADGNGGLQYHADSQTYTYVWKTSKAFAGSCRLLTVALDDGTRHEALFSFR